MDSRELGLVLVQQVTDVEELHYGFWEEGTPPSVLDIKGAQKRYSDMVVAAVREATAGTGSAAVLDVGCGTGALLVRLLALGFRADGVIPAEYLQRQVEQRLRAAPGAYRPAIYGCTLEAFPETSRNNQYDVVLFSESFQYIPLADSFRILPSLLKPGGKVIVCDFFKSGHHGDGGPGDKSFGGGHPIAEFHERAGDGAFRIVSDRDITKNVSPTIELLDQILMKKAYPALKSIDRFLAHNHRAPYALVKFLFRKRLNKIAFKYFAGHRSRQTFERYKTYRLIVLEHQGRPPSPPRPSL